MASLHLPRVQTVFMSNS